MTLLSLIQRKSFNNGFANAMMGILIGTPLGVCVNCAAPIAKGLHSAGTRIETTLATMTSSPTFNIIVVTILFSLFPWYVVATKLGFTLLFIAVGIPLMCKILFSRQELETIGERVEIHNGEVCEVPLGSAACAVDIGPTGWFESVGWVVKTFLGTLWYIVKTTVPLMFAAGFLGSLFIIAVPWDVVTGTLPEIEGAIWVLAAMCLLALFGTFLPVPIAFDIIVVAILMAAGLPIHYVMVLLFTLGIFSIYSASVVWNYISRKAAVALFVMVAGFGVLAGIAAHYIEDWEAERQHSTMVSLLLDPSKLIEPARYDRKPGVDDLTLVGELRAGAEAQRLVATAAGGKVNVIYLPYADRGEVASGRFERVQGPAIGVDNPVPYTLNRLNPPVHWSRGISAGDVHNDGWPDILMAADKVTYRGIALFANRAGKDFVEQAINIPIISGLRVVNAALADLNNDGWLDIFVASYRGGNYIVYNDNGRFHANNLVHLPDNGAAVAAAVAFGDIDKDGDLDIVLGNWGLGMFRLVMPGEPASSVNQLLIQENGEFVPRDLKSYPGETLTMLMTDFNGDGNLDLIVGNEFDASDIYYLGDGKGNLNEITSADGVIPHTVSSSMSIASADLDNDLRPEIYLGQITTGVGAGFAKALRTPDAECDYLADEAERSACVAFFQVNTTIIDSRPKQDATFCLDIIDPLTRQDCMALHVLWRAWMEKDKRLCDLIPSIYGDYAAICADIFKTRIQPTRDEVEAQIQQVTNFNVLLVGDTESGYQDRAKDSGIHVTGWTWNANFADVDNNEFMDLYVANGRVPSNKRESNFFFANRGGAKFENFTEQYNLIDFRASSASSFMDFDRDGDIDIIGVPAAAPVQFYVNRINDNRGFTVELRDLVGNRNGIGSKVYIAYGESGARKQMREIQLSGGFLSFNEPVAHFGLGEHDEVRSIEVHWSTGERSLIDGPFPASGRYIVERRG